MKTLQPAFITIMGWLLLSPMLSFGQANITGAFLLEPGERSDLVACDTVGVLPGAAGSNITWDFSGLTANASQYAPYTDFYWEGIDPTNAPMGNDFPDAETGYLQFDSTYSFVSTDGCTLEWTGFVGFTDSSTVKSTYSNGERWVTPPFTFGDSLTDNFAGTNIATTSFGTFSAPFSGTLTWKVDGYGTLILPNATYNNVVRMNLRRVSTTNPPIGSSTTTTNDNYLWFSPDHEYIVLDIENTFTDNPPPVPSTTSKRVFYANNPPASSGSLNCITGIPVSDVIDQLAVTPNPVHDRAQLSFNLTETEVLSISVNDLTGRTVTDLGSAAYPPGRQSVPIYTGNLAKGYYIISVSGQQGQVSQTLIVQ